MKRFALILLAMYIFTVIALYKNKWQESANQKDPDRGKTFIAHFPPGDLCLFEGAEK